MSLPLWVSTDAPYCLPDESVREAMRKMNRWDCESLPVCDDSRKLVGTISMRAVCLYADSTGTRVAGIRVREALEPETPACIPDEPAPDIMRRMSEIRQWCLPMVDHSQVLIGMVRFHALQRIVEGAADVIRIFPKDGSAEAPSLPEIGLRGWSVNEASMELLSPTGDRRHLTRAELTLLLVLAKHSGTVLRRETLMHSICDRQWDPSDRYIDVLVGNLRKKFGESASSARTILTVPREGYLFTLRVESPFTDGETSSSQPRSRSEAAAMSEPSIDDIGTTQDHVRSLTLNEVNRLYGERGEAAAHAFCVKHRAIASICMSCSRLFRVIDSKGSSGGLSHGWCSAHCIQIGAARAKTG